MQTNSVDGLILLGPDFQETPVIDCLVAWREEGLAVWLVGVSEIVCGQHGLVIRVDRMLGDIPPDVAICQLLIPGGQKCARTLLSDPRVHSLMRRTIDHGGRVGALKAAKRELRLMGLWSPEHFYEPQITNAERFAPLFTNPMPCKRRMALTPAG